MTNQTKHLPPANCPWVVCQIGAREHYAVARALANDSRLAALVTDVWVGPCHPLRFGFWPRLKQRYHPGLAHAAVVSWPWETAFQNVIPWRKLQHWERIMAQNEWFGLKAAQTLERMRFQSGAPPVVFSYSYTARPVFEVGKRLGYRTVLGQIDCGPEQQQQLRALAENNLPEPLHCKIPPPSYWETWRRELELADALVVNSDWAREHLLRQGVTEHKIAVIPLAYEPPAACANFNRAYPASFSTDRPLRVLFLGQINLLKGVAVVLEAIKSLAGEPIQFSFVGPELLPIPEEFRNLPNVHWIGPVERNRVPGSFRDADVFLFPTFSDGYGLTQLEAQAWKLPVIASRFCGKVVTDEVNGLILPEVTAASVCAALRRCLGDPATLAEFSRHSVAMSDYSLAALAGKLTNRVQEILEQNP